MHADQQSQQGRLASTVGCDQAEELAAFHAEVNAAQHLYGAEVLLHCDQIEYGRVAHLETHAWVR